MRLFAVEPDSAQVMWHRFPAGGIADASVGGTTTTVEGPAGEPFVTTLPGVDGALDPPPGRLLSRFATISDLHIGERGFGLLHTMHEKPEPAEGYPLRCARAAIREALAWGAEALVVKGDLTWSGRRVQWELVAELLAGLPVPLLVTLGNHDTGEKGIDPRPVLEAAGVELSDEPAAHDLPGIRLVVAHSARPALREGRIDAAQREKVAALIDGAPAAFLGVHHYPQRFARSVRYPAGLVREDGDPLLAAVAEANPRTLVSCGHSHRHRRHVMHGLTVTEVGSTKDYPGVWAGYAVHEGGIRQVVKRVEAPEAVVWTERSRRAVLGVWGLWSPGRLQWRCFSRPWPVVAQHP